MTRIVEQTREKVYTVAEIGACHQGSLDTAKRMIDACAWAGVDCVKGQKRHTASLFTDEELARPYTGPHSFGATYGEHREALEFTIEQHAELAGYANHRGMDYTVSVWDEVSCDEAVSIGVPWLKLPSAALLAQRLLGHAGSKGLPAVLSTGMASAGDVEAALSLPWPGWLGLMQSTSLYPCPFDAVDLWVLKKWGFNRSNAIWYVGAIGLSGHHLGIAIDAAAVALGARIIERHITLDRTQKGTDHAAALEPDGLRKLVRDIRNVEAAMGSGVKRFHEAERPVAAKLRTRKLMGG